MNDKHIEYIDNEEKELIQAYESINITKIKRPSTNEQKNIKKFAEEFLKKETKMNIRIDPYELEKIKKCAQEEGLKYQTFIKSVLHKYITGQLVEKNKTIG